MSRGHAENSEHSEKLKQMKELSGFCNNDTTEQNSMAFKTNFSDSLCDGNKSREACARLSALRDI